MISRIHGRESLPAGRRPSSGRRPSAETGAGAHAATSLLGLDGAAGGEFLADLLLLAADAVAADELVGDDHREHDHALDDVDDLLRRSRRCRARPRPCRGRPRERAERDADRVVAAEQGDGDAGEADAGREVEAVRVAVVSSVGMPTRPAMAPEISMR